MNAVIKTPVEDAQKPGITQQVADGIKRGLNYLATRKPRVIIFALSKGSWSFAKPLTPASEGLLAAIDQGNRLTVQEYGAIFPAVFKQSKPKLGYRGRTVGGLPPFTISSHTEKGKRKRVKYRDLAPENSFAVLVAGPVRKNQKRSQRTLALAK